MTQYIAILVPAESGHWRALIPDVPECQASEVGLLRTKEAVAQALARIVQSGVGTLPYPRTLLEIKRDQEWQTRNGVDFDSAIFVIVPSPVDCLFAPAGRA